MDIRAPLGSSLFQFLSCLGSGLQGEDLLDMKEDDGFGCWTSPGYGEGGCLLIKGAFCHQLCPAQKAIAIHDFPVNHSRGNHGTCQEIPVGLPAGPFIEHQGVFIQNPG